MYFVVHISFYALYSPWVVFNI